MKSNQFEAFGIAAMLPGMRLAHEALGKQIEDYERQLAALQGQPTPAEGGEWLTVSEIMKLMGWSKTAVMSRAQRERWPKQKIPGAPKGTPRMRYAQSAVEASIAGHPARPKHTQDAAAPPMRPPYRTSETTRKKLSRIAKKRLAGLSKKELSERMKRIAAGKKLGPDKPKRRKGATLPAQIDGWFTRVGAAEHAGVSISTVESWMRTYKPKTRQAPISGRRAATLLDPVFIDQMIAERNGAQA